MKSSTYKVIIALLTIVIFWMGISIVNLESYRYANQLGMCSGFQMPEEGIERAKCLSEAETRTSFVWHLLYGLGVL